MFVLFLLTDVIFPFHPKIEYSTMVYAKNESLLYAFLTSDDKWRFETELNEITPELQKTIIYKEDKYFQYHFGVNPVAIVRALFNNFRYKEITSGASTITMQVARMLDRKPRSYKNKLKEIFRAFQLELHFTKKEILRMYFNLVPYGGNIEGMKTAAYFYFDQKPEALSLSQIVMLSIIPNNPNRYKPGENNSLLLEKRNSWLDFFDRNHLFEKVLISDAKAENINCYRHFSPKLAPHLATRLKINAQGKIRINTCINLNSQKKIENITYQYISVLRNRNITNAAVLVLNNKTREIEVYVGSADFWDKKFDGQVDGVRALRSPGSALKPFLYTLAFDKGIATPKNIISDVPINYDGYRPENYDSKYNGLLSIEKALGMSLNIPAVKILDQVGIESFIEKLSEAGFSLANGNKNKYGLSIILGGCGVKLEEMVRMYSSLASDGVLFNMKYLAEEKTTAIDTLFTKAGTFMTNEILSSLIRPDLPNKFESSLNMPKIAWKTGTSYGRRDAWAFGYNTNYTVGVWIGNFPGYGSPELNGAEHAVPLLFQIFNTIDYNSDKEWYNEPPDISTRMVCSESGLIPNEFCTNLVEDYFIPGISSNSLCQHLIEAYTDKNELISFCKSCKPEAGFKKVLFPNLPGDIISFYEEQQIPYKRIPSHNAKCQRVFESDGPKITSLTPNMEYLIFKTGSTKLMLRCQAANDVNYVYWYINDKLLGKIKANESIFFVPEEGEIKISCTDDKGRNSNISISVEYL